MTLPMSLLGLGSLCHKHTKLQELTAFHRIQVPQSLILAWTPAGAAPPLPIKTNRTHHILSISNIIHLSLASHLLMSYSTYNSRTRIIQLIMVFIGWASNMSDTHPPVAPQFIIDPLHALPINPTTLLLLSSMNK